MTAEQLQAIKERAEYATDGPWKVVKSEESGVQIGTTWEHGQLKVGVPVVTTAHGVGGTTIYINQNNAEFIAHAREDVPALIAEVEWLREAIDRKNEIHDALNRDYVKLRDENERLREALEFYADKANYSYSDISSPEILADYGRKARKALAGESNE